MQFVWIYRSSTMRTFGVHFNPIENPKDAVTQELIHPRSGYLPALSLFLNGQLTLHRSWKIPETVALYYTPSKYGRGKFRPGKCEVKHWVDPVLDSPPGPLAKIGLRNRRVLTEDHKTMRVPYNLTLTPLNVCNCILHRSCSALRFSYVCGLPICWCSHFCTFLCQKLFDWRAFWQEKRLMLP
jgi:hypothetical protein